MADFDIIGALQLQGPTGLGTVRQQIQSGLRGIQANVDITYSQGAIGNTNQLNAGLTNLNSTLRLISSSSRDAASGIASLNTALASGRGATNNYVSQIRNISNVASGSRAALSGAANDIQNFGYQAGLSGRRLLAFGVGATSIVTFINSLRNGFSEALKFQNEMVRLGQVSGDTSDQVGKLQSRVTSLAVGLGVSSKELSVSATTLRQAGQSIAEVSKNLEAVALADLAPNFRDQKQVVEGLIAANAQFKKSNEDSVATLGSLNAVAGQFAVEASDLVTVIQRAGGAFSAAGGDVKELAALFTSVRATTRESAETISSSLRTIFSRLQSNDTVDALRDLRINLRYTKEEASRAGDLGLENQFVGAYEAVRRLSQGLAGLRQTDPRYAQIVDEIGGKRNVSKIIPLIQEQALAQQAYNVAQAGGVSLAISAEKAQESLSVQLTKVREEYQALFNAITTDDGFQNLAKGALVLASAIAKIVDSIRPLVPLIALVGAAKIGTTLISQAPALSSGLFRGGRHYASGGHVPGSGSGDTVPAWLEPGEFIFTKQAVQNAGGPARMRELHNELKSQQSKSEIPRFAKGGMVGAKRYSQGGELQSYPAKNFDDSPIYPEIQSALAKLGKTIDGTTQVFVDFTEAGPVFKGLVESVKKVQQSLESTAASLPAQSAGKLSKEEQDKLLIENKGLPARIAGGFVNSGFITNASDGESAAQLAMVQAVRTFDPSKGEDFPSYAGRIAANAVIKDKRGTKEKELNNGASGRLVDNEGRNVQIPVGSKGGILDELSERDTTKLQTAFGIANELKSVPKSSLSEEEQAARNAVNRVVRENPDIASKLKEAKGLSLKERIAARKQQAIAAPAEPVVTVSVPTPVAPEKIRETLVSLSGSGGKGGGKSVATAAATPSPDDDSSQRKRNIDSILTNATDGNYEEKLRAKVLADRLESRGVKSEVDLYRGAVALPKRAEDQLALRGSGYFARALSDKPIYGPENPGQEFLNLNAQQNLNAHKANISNTVTNLTDGNQEELVRASTIIAKLQARGVRSETELYRGATQLPTQAEDQLALRGPGYFARIAAERPVLGPVNPGREFLENQAAQTRQAIDTVVNGIVEGNDESRTRTARLQRRVVSESEVYRGANGLSRQTDDRLAQRGPGYFQNLAEQRRNDPSRFIGPANNPRALALAEANVYNQRAEIVGRVANGNTNTFDRGSRLIRRNQLSESELARATRGIGNAGQASFLDSNITERGQGFFQNLAEQRRLRSEASAARDLAAQRAGTFIGPLNTLGPSGPQLALGAQDTLIQNAERRRQSNARRDLNRALVNGPSQDVQENFNRNSASFDRQTRGRNLSPEAQRRIAEGTARNSQIEDALAVREANARTRDRAIAAGRLPTPTIEENVLFTGRNIVRNPQATSAHAFIGPPVPVQGPPAPTRSQRFTNRLTSITERLNGAGLTEEARNARNFRIGGLATGGLYAASLVADSLSTDASVAVANNDTARYRAQRTISGGLAGAATGFGIGATIGSVVPGLGTVVGGAVGAGIGAVAGGAHSFSGSGSDIIQTRINNNINQLNDQLANLSRSGGLANSTSLLDTKSSLSAYLKNTTEKNTNAASGFFTGFSQTAFGDLQNKSLRQDLGTQLPQIMEALSKQASALGASAPNENIKDLTKRLSDGGSGLNKELIQIVAQLRGISVEKALEEFSKNISAAASQTKLQAQQLARRGTEERAINSFARLASSVSSAAESLKRFEARSEALSSLFTGIVGGTTLTGNADNLKNLGRLDKSALEPIGLASKLGGVDGQKLLGTGTAIDAVARILPGVLSRVASKAPAEGQDFISATRNGILQGLNLKPSEVSPELNTVLSSIIRQLEDQTKSGTGDINNELEVDPNKLVDKLIGNAGEAVVRATTEIVKNFEVASNEFVNGLVDLTKRVGTIREGLSQLDTLQLNSARTNADFAAGRTGGRATDFLSLQQLQAPFDLRQQRLTGLSGRDSANPDLLAGLLRKANSDVLSAEEAQKQAFQNPGANGQNFKAAAENLVRLKDSASNYRQALENLTKTTERAAGPLEKLGRIQQEKDGRLGFAERFYSSDIEGRNRLNRGLALSDAANNAGSLDGFQPADQQLILDTLRTLGPSTITGFQGAPQADVLLRKLLENSGGGFATLTPAQQAEQAALQGRVQGINADAEVARGNLNENAIDLNQQLFDGLRTQQSDFFTRLEQFLNRDKIATANTEVSQLSLKQGRLNEISGQRNNLARFGIKSPEQVKALNDNREVLNAVNPAATKLKEIQNLGLKLFEQTGKDVEGSAFDIKPVILSSAQQAERQRVTNEYLARPQFNALERTQKDRIATASQATIKAGQFDGTLFQGNVKQNVSRAIQAAIDTELLNGGAGTSIGDARQNLTKATTDVGNLNIRGVDNAKLNQTLQSNPQAVLQSLDKLSEFINLNPGQSFAILDQQIQETAAGLARLNGVINSFGGVEAEPQFRSNGGSIFQSRGSDTVPAMLTPDEFVVNPRSAKANTSLLKKINDAKGPVYLAGGGFAGPNSTSTADLFRYLKLIPTPSQQKKYDSYKSSGVKPFGDGVDASQLGKKYAEDKRRKEAEEKVLIQKRVEELNALENPAARGEQIDRAFAARAANEQRRARKSYVGPINLPKVGSLPPIPVAAEKQKTAADESSIDLLARLTAQDEAEKAKLPKKRSVENRFADVNAGNRARRTETLQEYRARRAGVSTQPQGEVVPPAVGAANAAFFAQQQAYRNLQFRQQLANADDPGAAFGLGRADFGNQQRGFVNSLTRQQQYNDFRARQNPYYGFGSSPQRLPDKDIGTASSRFRRQFATGGYVGGAGNKDSVEAMVMPGEYILNQSATARLGKHNLDRVNHYAEGGVVGRAPGSVVGTTSSSPANNSLSQTSLQALGTFSQSASLLVNSITVFGQSTSTLSQSFNMFNGTSAALADALNKMPRTMTGQFTHQVNLNHNGAELLNSMMPEIQKIVLQDVKREIGKIFKNQMPDADINVE